MIYTFEYLLMKAMDWVVGIRPPHRKYDLHSLHHFWFSWRHERQQERKGKLIRMMLRAFPVIWTCSFASKKEKRLRPRPWKAKKAPRMQVEEFVANFKRVCWRAVSQVFPTVPMFGCAFKLSQRISRKLKILDSKLAIIQTKPSIQLAEDSCSFTCSPIKNSACFQINTSKTLVIRDVILLTL